MFLPKKEKQELMSYDNPTLTGREADLPITKKQSPKDYAFVYCISTFFHPFRVWDCLRVRESETRPYPTPMEMYHNYITKLLKKVKSFIQNRRLFIQVSLANCMDFPSVHNALKMPNYDRIFTSNIADYVGLAKLLQDFKPLLNSSNHYSVLITETMIWAQFLFKSYCLHTGMNYDDLKKNLGLHNWMDYLDNAPYFVGYLRAQIMAGGLGILPLTNVPSFEDVMKYNGLEMRDFRKKQNRLVPFQYRVNNRDLTLINVNDRAVEWCLPHTDG